VRFACRGSLNRLLISRLSVVLATVVLLAFPSARAQTAAGPQRYNQGTVRRPGQQPGATSSRQPGAPSSRQPGQPSVRSQQPGQPGEARSTRRSRQRATRSQAARSTTARGSAAGTGARGTGAAGRGGGTSVVYGSGTSGATGTAQGRTAFEPYREFDIEWKELPAKADQVLTLPADQSGINIASFLQTISDTMGWTVMMSEEVPAKQVHAWINDITVRDALKILQLANLYYEYDKDTNVLRVMTEDEYYLEKYGKVERFEYDVRHADVLNMQSTLESMLSPQGRIIADGRLSRLIIFDTKYNLDYIKQLLRILDVKIQPVCLPLEHVHADEMMDEVEYLLSPEGIAQADMRTNQIIVSDIPEGVNRVRALVEALDVEVMTQTYDLKYAEIEEVENMLMDVIPQEMGQIQVDDRMKQITVVSTPQKVMRATEIIDMLDKESRQVHIKAYIMRANADLIRNLGINWSQLARTPDGEPVNISVAPPLSGGSEVVNIDITDYDFSAVIELLLQDSDTEVLSEPEITVSDGESASFRVQTRVPYLSGSSVRYDSTGTPAAGEGDDDYTRYYRYFPQKVQWENVGVQLQVTPEINIRGDIFMALGVEDSNYQTIELPGVGSVPQVTAASTDTTMLVASGSTVILGGLRGGRRDDSVDKVPILGDIPLFGRAFRTTHQQDSYQELMIFITPTVVGLGPSPNLEDLDQFRQELHERSETTRKWPLGWISKGSVEQLPPVPRGEPTVDESSESAIEQP